MNLLKNNLKKTLIIIKTTAFFSLFKSKKSIYHNMLRRGGGGANFFSHLGAKFLNAVLLAHKSYLENGFFAVRHGNCAILTYHTVKARVFRDSDLPPLLNNIYATFRKL